MKNIYNIDPIQVEYELDGEHLHEFLIALDDIVDSNIPCGNDDDDISYWRSYSIDLEMANCNQDKRILKEILNYIQTNDFDDIVYSYNLYVPNLIRELSEETF